MTPIRYAPGAEDTLISERTRSDDSRFTRCTATDLVDEWHEAAGMSATRPTGCRTWQLRRAYRDLTVTGAIDRETRS